MYIDLASITSGTDYYTGKTADEGKDEINAIYFVNACLIDTYKCTIEKGLSVLQKFLQNLWYPEPQEGDVFCKHQDVQNELNKAISFGNKESKIDALYAVSSYLTGRGYLKLSHVITQAIIKFERETPEVANDKEKARQFAAIASNWSKTDPLFTRKAANHMANILYSIGFCYMADAYQDIMNTIDEDE